MDAIRLRDFNRLVARHIETLGTREDFKILLEIAASQQKGTPLTLKQLLIDVNVPQSTLKRRLASLVRRRIVTKQMTANDHRVYCYNLSDKAQTILKKLIADIREYHWS